MPTSWFSVHAGGRGIQVEALTQTSSSSSKAQTSETRLHAHLQLHPALNDCFVSAVLMNFVSVDPSWEVGNMNVNFCIYLPDNALWRLTVQLYIDLSSIPLCFLPKLLVRLPTSAMSASSPPSSLKICSHFLHMQYHRKKFLYIYGRSKRSSKSCFSCIYIQLVCNLLV